MIRIEITDAARENLEKNVSLMVRNSLQRRNKQWVNDIHNLMRSMRNMKLYWWVRMFYPKFTRMVNTYYQGNRNDFGWDFFQELMSCAPNKLRNNPMYMYDEGFCREGLEALFQDICFAVSKSDELIVDIAFYKMHEHEIDLAYNEEYFNQQVIK